MSIVLQGSTSGSITLQEPAVAGSTVLDLPATSGTLITTGSTGQVIPKAALPTGSVLQVVQGTGTAQLSTSSSSLVTTGFSASITPTSATSKIYVVFNGRIYNNTTGADASLAILRGATNIQSGKSLYNGAGGIAALQTISILDSPATTSSTTYTMYFAVGNGTTYINVNGSGDGTYTLTLMEIAA